MAVTTFNPSHNYQCAQVAAQHGFKIIPWGYNKDGDKQPALARDVRRGLGWRNWATSDPKRLETWFGTFNRWCDKKKTPAEDQYYPFCYPGIAYGRESNAWMLDVDTHEGGANGYLTLAGLLAAHPDEPLPQTTTMRTPSGGQHLLFAYPPDFEIQTSGSTALGPGLDSRGWGGFGPVPGCKTSKGLYEVLQFVDPLPRAPRWLEEMVRRNKPVTNDQVWTASSNGHGPGLDYVAWLEECNDIIDGQYQHLFEGLCSMRARSMEPTLMSQWAYAAAERFARVKPDRSPPWTRELADKKLNDVLNAYPAGHHSQMIAADIVYTEEYTDAAVGGHDAPMSSPMEQWTMRELNDNGNGDRLIDHYGKYLRVMADLKGWAVYDDGIWSWGEVANSLVKTYCRNVYLRLPHTEALLYDDTPKIAANGNVTESDRAKFLSWVHDQGDERPLVAMEGAGRRHADKFSAQNLFDTRDDLINTPNGVLILPIRGNDPESYIPDAQSPGPDWLCTKKTRARYDPNAKIYWWDKILYDQFPDPYERFWFEIELAYACLRNSNYLKHGIFLVGANDSGKSQILNALQFMLGSYGGTFEPSMLRGKNSAGARPDVYAAMLRRLIVATEMSESAEFHADHIKRLWGNDVISARMLFKNEYLERRPCFTCIIAVNGFPEIKGADLAFLERLVTFDFPNTIPRELRIHNLDKMLEAEADAIFTRLVDRLRYEHLLVEVPLRFQRAAAAALSSSSIVATFYEQFEDGDGHYSNFDLLSLWQEFNKAMNIPESRQMSMDSLGRYLSGLGWKSEVLWYQGKTQRVRVGKILKAGYSVADEASNFLEQHWPGYGK